MTPEELQAFLGPIGHPVLLLIAGIFILAQFASERLTKILGPFGKLGRWWHTREERAEEDLQRLLVARAKTGSYQIQEMERQLRFFLEAMEQLRDQNQELRDELGEMHQLLNEARRELNTISTRLDTDERLAVRIPSRPPPPPTGRHRDADDVETTRLPRVEG